MVDWVVHGSKWYSVLLPWVVWSKGDLEEFFPRILELELKRWVSVYVVETLKHKARKWIAVMFSDIWEVWICCDKEGRYHLGKHRSKMEKLWSCEHDPAARNSLSLVMSLPFLNIGVYLCFWFFETYSNIYNTLPLFFFCLNKFELGLLLIT